MGLGEVICGWEELFFVAGEALSRTEETFSSAGERVLRREEALWERGKACEMCGYSQLFQTIFGEGSVRNGQVVKVSVISLCRVRMRGRTEGSWQVDQRKPV